MRTLALASVVSMLVAGCYGSHARPFVALGVEDGGTDAAVVDVPERDGGSDAGSADAGRPDPADAGPPCSPDPEDTIETVLSVSPTGALPAAEPFDLTLRWSRCGCDLDRGCAVAVRGDVITIDAVSCVSDVDCDDCRFEQACEVPALAEGTYRLVVNGVTTYAVRAARQPTSRLRRPATYELPTPPDGALTCAFPGDDRIASAEVCRPRRTDVGTYVPFTITSACRSCFDWTGGCRVLLDGDALRVAPRITTCECPTCGACPDVCVPIEVECRSPPLRAGTYRVIVEHDGTETELSALEVEDVTTIGASVCEILD